MRDKEKQRIYQREWIVLLMVLFQDIKAMVISAVVTYVEKLLSFI